MSLQELLQKLNDRLDSQDKQLELLRNQNATLLSRLEAGIHQSLPARSKREEVIIVRFQCIGPVLISVAGEPTAARGML